MKKKLLIAAALFLTVGAFGGPARAFSDISENSPYYLAVETLAQSGVISGYEDGTFRPAQAVNRAEGLKMILAAAGAGVKKGLYNTGFPDVPLDIWYAGYVMEGSLRGIIGGNPDGTFAGARTVNKAEFLKMVIKTFQIDLAAHQSPGQPIAPDVPLREWYAPYLSYAKEVGLTYPTMESLLEPGKLLTRGECAQIVYKMALIKFGSPAQESLAMAEASIIESLIRIHHNDVIGALESSEKALLHSATALKAEPDSATVKATHLISQAFRKLYFAYAAGLEKSYAQVVVFVKEAKDLANAAVKSHASAQFFGTKIHEHGDTLLSQLGY